MGLGRIAGTLGRVAARGGRLGARLTGRLALGAGRFAALEVIGSSTLHLVNALARRFDPRVERLAQGRTLESPSLGYEIKTGEGLYPGEYRMIAAGFMPRVWRWFYRQVVLQADSYERPDRFPGYRKHLRLELIDEVSELIADKRDRAVAPVPGWSVIRRVRPVHTKARLFSTRPYWPVLTPHALKRLADRIHKEIVDVKGAL